MNRRGRNRGLRGRPQSDRSEFGERSVKTMRERAFKLAVERGTSPEEAAKVHDAALMKESDPDRGAHFNFEENTAYFTRYEGKQEVPSYFGISTKEGYIPKTRQMSAKASLAHELMHAAQGERYSDDALKAEREAETLERVVAGEEVDIGMHPGQKGQHFFEKGLSNAVPQIQNLFYNTIRGEIAKYGWIN